VGTPGGSRIITTVLEIIVNVIDHGMTLQEAVDARESIINGCGHPGGEPFAFLRRHGQIVDPHGLPRRALEVWGAGNAAEAIGIAPGRGQGAGIPPSGSPLRSERLTSPGGSAAAP